MFLDEFKEAHDKVLNKLFIVNAPLALRDDVYDHDIGVKTGDVKYDSNARDNFGISILRMAEAFHVGLGFRLVNKEDLLVLVDIMEKYLSLVDNSKQFINFKQVDTNQVDLVYAFGINVVELNRINIPSKDDHVSTVTKSIGVTDFNKALEKVKENKKKNPKMNVSSKRIKRFKPMDF